MAHARVLAERVHSLQPAEVTVLVVDQGEEPLPEVGGARVLGLCDIGLDRDTALLLGLTRSPTEVARSVQPRLLGSLLDEGADHAVLLAPSVVVRARLDRAVELARSRSVVLLPRLLAPIPLDDRQPRDAEAVRFGAISHAVVAVGDTEAARGFLGWWQQRAESLPGPAGDNLLDLALVALSEHVVLRDPAWGLSRWTAPAVELTPGPQGAVQVDGRTLVFADLEGYDPDRPHLLSTADGEHPRTLLSESSELRGLTEDHRRRLLGAGYDEVAGLPAPYASVDGVTVDRRIRGLVRAHLARGQDPGPITASLSGWLSQAPPSARGFPVVGRLLLDVLSTRPDLRLAFPEVEQGHVEGFLAWATAHGEREEGLTLKVVELVRERLAGPPETATHLPADGDGVHLVGFFTADLGIGQAARMLVDGLEAAGVPVSTTTYGGTESRRGTPWTERRLGERATEDVVIVCLNADTLARFAAEEAGRLLEGRYVVGLWFWEVDVFPEDMRPSLDLVDEVWVASEFNRTVLADLTDKPVHVVPLPVHVAESRDVLDLDRVVPPELKTAEQPFTFGFVFDHLSVFERKNPLGLVNAYRRAFPEPLGTRLVIKSINGDKRPAEREALRYAVANSPDVVLVERYLSRAELDALMWAMDCFVSLHRAEGFGFTMAEAMGMGKAVIATGYSGNLAFMDDANSRLVRHTLVPVPPGNPPYPTTARWARPSLRHAAAVMRRLHADPGLVARLGERARLTIASRHSPEATGAVAAARLAQIRLARRR